MKALSLYQPFASAVVLGAKRIETRSWATNYRGPLLIHAARTTVGIELVRNEPNLWRAVLGVAAGETLDQTFRALPFGALVARCELVDCIAAADVESIRATARRIGEKYSPWEHQLGDYTRGRWAWMLRDVRPLSETIPLRAYQRLFDVDPDVLVGKGGLRDDEIDARARAKERQRGAADPIGEVG